MTDKIDRDTAIQDRAQFRIVLVGAGAIARVAHLPAILASNEVRLVAVVEADVARGKQLCLDHGIGVPVFDSLDAMDVAADAAVVAVPNHLHAAIATKLVERDIHVLVEKPLATDVADGEALVALAEAKRVTLAVGYHTRHSGACRALHHCITTSQFGRVLRFAHQDGSVGGWAPVSAYNLDRKLAGGGVLVTTGTHFLDRLVWLHGDPQSCRLSDDADGGPESHCIARFTVGAGEQAIEGSALFSKVVSLMENSVYATEQGLLVMPRDVGEEIFFLPKHDPDMRMSVRLNAKAIDPRGLYQRQLEDFVHACRSGEAPAVSGREGLRSLRLVQQLYQSRQPLPADRTAREKVA